MSWRPTPIAAITDVVTKGTTPTTLGRQFADSGVNFIKAEALNGDSGLNVEGFFHIDEDTHQLLGRSVLQENDVLVTIAGANVGKCGYVKAEYLPANTNQAVGIVRVDKAKAIPRFVYYFFKQPRTFAFCQSLGGQAAQPNVNLTVLKSIELPLPNLGVQQAIADSLSAYDDLMENNRRRMSLLEEAALQLYREWFIRLRFPGREHTTITNGIPEGWEPRRLGDLCEEVRESVNPDTLEPDTPYIGLVHMPRRSISLSEWGKAEQVTSSKHRFREGEILFGKIRPYFHKVGIAFVDGVASSDAIVIRPLNAKLGGVVLMTASSDPFIAVTAQTMREGSKMPRADWKQMQRYEVPLPPDGILSNFESAIQSVVEQLKTLTFANKKLRAARDLLLPRLMNGEVSV
jgi:type I restriction enzyme S subunit